MESMAVAKYMRISAQKVRKLAAAIKGKPLEDGLNHLEFMPQKSAKIVKKVLHSALANATQKNNDVHMDDLVIQNVIADEGPTLKRFRARARGRGTRILKRTSHITVILSTESL